jgi:hypothetical protein
MSATEFNARQLAADWPTDPRRPALLRELGMEVTSWPPSS